MVWCAVHDCNADSCRPPRKFSENELRGLRKADSRSNEQRGEDVPKQRVMAKARDSAETVLGSEGEGSPIPPEEVRQWPVRADNGPGAPVDPDVSAI